MYNYAIQSLTYLPGNFEHFVSLLRKEENNIAKEGRKHFILYEPDPVNYWEVYARLACKVMAVLEKSISTKTLKELTN